MYISSSQIVETGYTQGNQFVISYNQQPYKGFYHKDNQGRYWSDKEHTVNSFLLTTTTPTPNFSFEAMTKNSPVGVNYTKCFTDDLSTPLLKSDFIFPTEDNYTKGFFVRYFAQLKNSTQPYIIEVNYNTYNTFSKDKNITNHYLITTLLWQLTGPINDVYNNNIRTTPGIKDTNLRSIQDTERTFPNLSSYLIDPFQFARIPADENTNRVQPQPYVVDYGVIREEIDLILPTPPTTPSNSPTPTVTPSVTPTISITPSNTASISVTPSNTATPTPSVTSSISVTPSQTASTTPSITSTPSVTPGNTASVTPSITSTPSITPSNTPSVTASSTPSVTPSVTATVTPSNTATPSNTPSVTASVTPSNTTTPSNTPSATASVTPSITPTPSMTAGASASVTPSITVTPSNTATPSVTPSRTASVTPSNTATPSVTPSRTTSVTPSNTTTPSVTASTTPSNTATPSVTPSITASVTPSNTVTPSVTPSNTVTPSITPSVTPSSTATPSITPTPTITPTSTPYPPDCGLVSGSLPWYSYFDTAPQGTLTNNTSTTMYVWLGAGVAPGTNGNFSTNSPFSSLSVAAGEGFVNYSSTYLTLSPAQSWPYSITRTSGNATTLDVNLYWSTSTSGTKVALNCNPPSPSTSPSPSVTSTPSTTPSVTPSNIATPSVTPSNTSSVTLIVYEPAAKSV